VSGWISIGEPDVQSFTPLEKQVKRYLDKGYHPNVISCIIKQSREQTRDLIYEIRKKEGIMRKATVSDEEMRTMKMMQAEGKTVREIAEATGRGRSTVDRIVNDRKAAKINKEFDAAVDQMIETMHSEPEPVQLEDIENGIPNTPLVAENADKKSAIAEEKFTNAEEWRLPYNVQVAVDRYISDIDEEIAMRAQRIAELTQELEEWTAKRADLAGFRKAYGEKVAAAARTAS
jgi:DNA-binding CsgD family transcriptional regulator